MTSAPHLGRRTQPLAGRLACAVGLALCLVADQVGAQTPPSLLRLEPLAGGAQVLIGKSGNVVIVPSPDGTLIIDAQRGSDAEQTLAAAHQVAAGPIRYVIDTHWHLDHSGGNAALARAGAVIIAQRNVRVRKSAEQFMAAYNSRIPAAPAIAWPTIVFDDGMEIFFGSEDVVMRHARNAHTDGDTIVRLRTANVIHMGDLYFNGIPPFIDRSSGGDIRGLIAAIDMALSMADDQTKIVPAHGPVATKTELLAYRDMLRDVAARVKHAVAAGKTKAQVQAMKPAAAYESKIGADADEFVGIVYECFHDRKAASAGAEPRPHPRANVHHARGK